MDQVLLTRLTAGNQERRPAAGFVENPAPQSGASGNPSREPPSHELVKWYPLETCAAYPQLPTVTDSLPCEGQMARVVVVVPWYLCSERAL